MTDTGERPLDSVRSHSSYLNWLNAAIRAGRFAVIIVIAFVIYRVLISRILTRKIHIFTYVFFWLFTAYVILPWLNRRIAHLYLPDYFIGRARTGDGLLGDPINLAFYGREEDIIAAFEATGWTRAESLSFKSSVKMTWSSLLGRPYDAAPVSSLFLFSERQHLAFEREINNNPRRRHHVRLWKTPEHWHLPGGGTADWLGAATYDKNIGVSLFTGQITHKINGHVDQERDFVLSSLKRSPLTTDVKIVKHFTSSYHSRGGGGDWIETDGALPFITVKRNTTD